MEATITYEEAKKRGLALNDSVNACKEYSKAYNFYKYDTEIITGDCGVVVLKETGRAISLVSFLMDYHPEKNPKEIEF